MFAVTKTETERLFVQKSGFGTSRFISSQDNQRRLREHSSIPAQGAVGWRGSDTATATHAIGRRKTGHDVVVRCVILAGRGGEGVDPPRRGCASENNSSTPHAEGSFAAATIWMICSDACAGQRWVTRATGLGEWGHAPRGGSMGGPLWSRCIRVALTRLGAFLPVRHTKPRSHYELLPWLIQLQNGREWGKRTFTQALRIGVRSGGKSVVACISRRQLNQLPYVGK